MITCNIETSLNGKPTVVLMVADTENNRTLTRKLSLWERSEIDGAIDEIESAFGPAAAGDAHTLLDAEAKKAGSKPSNNSSDMPDDAPALPQPISAGILCRDYPEMRPPIIHGIARETETINIISNSKRGKTALAMGLALSICTGRSWLGMYQVEQGNVLYIDAELHPNTYAKRLHWIAQTMGILSEQFADALDILSLRGRLLDIHRLAPFFASIPHRKYRVIVLDALYRLIPPGVDENSNSEMTLVYNAIDKYAEQTGAAIIIVHHASKGMQSGKSVTDVGAGAGSQSRATDSHIVLREHDEDDVVVMEGACRSFPPPVPVCLRWKFPVWTHEPNLDPSDLRVDNKRRKISGVQEVAPEPKIQWTPEKFVETFVTTEAKAQTIVLAKAECVLSVRESKRYLDLAVDAGIAYRWRSANRTVPIRIATTPQPVTDTAEVKK